MKFTTVCLLAIFTLMGETTASAIAETVINRGEYLFHAGACESCHTDIENGGAFLAGGREMQTQFGTFYTPNITPDPETGIGRWTLPDFHRAMIAGIRPDGSPYYPIFPYRWYTGMTAADIAALWVYLQSVEPVSNPVPPHDLTFPFSIRTLVYVWRWVNFAEGQPVSEAVRWNGQAQNSVRLFAKLFHIDIEQWVAKPVRSRQWQQGAYLVDHVGHCGACHTPKLLGNFMSGEYLAGSTQIPGAFPAPNITSDRETGIGTWSHTDIIRALQRAMRPDGTPIRGPMAEYVLHGSSYLSAEDLRAIAVYLLALPSEEHAVGVGATQPLSAHHHGSEGVKSLMASGASRTLAK
jgi:mono/diheme cytochrome c family protein